MAPCTFCESRCAFESLFVESKLSVGKFVLERFFNKSREEATRIMLHVHQKGVGLCGVYTYEVAETKVAQVLDMAQRNQHPLQCIMEKDD